MPAGYKRVLPALALVAALPGCARRSAPAAQPSGSKPAAEVAAAHAPATVASPGAAATMTSPHGVTAKELPTSEPIKVQKAGGADGRTVAELFAAKGSLKDKPVEVRGKGVKFLPEIMGKNWIHLRDGSGSRERKDDDITVTTKESVTVGSVVLLRGTLRVDRDMGGGLVYPVLVEDAKISK